MKNPRPVVLKNCVRITTLASSTSDSHSWKNGIAHLRWAAGAAPIA
ncbi:hypothetical protein ACIRQQ_46400 [Streptomyces fuscichromogenes]